MKKEKVKFTQYVIKNVETGDFFGTHHGWVTGRFIGKSKKGMWHEDITLIDFNVDKDQAHYLAENISNQSGVKTKVVEFEVREI